MGLVLELGVRIRKSMRTCYRSVCNHPFLVAMLLFVVVLHGSFPSVFSLLVTAFPVFACSAVLLGTLLIFGQPNTPEMKKDYMISHDIASHKARVARDHIVVAQRHGSFPIERRSRKAKVTAESSEVEDFDGSVGYVPLIDETLQHNHSQKIVIEYIERELDRKKMESKSKIDKEKVKNGGMTRDVKAIEEQLQKVGDEIIEGTDDTFHRDSSDPHKSDISESSLHGGGDDEAEDDEASDYGSDQADCSSPDASMADILPILDELHPLLDLEAPQQANSSPDKSDDDASDKSNDGSNESDEDVGNEGREGEQVGVEDNGVDEEEAQGGKEDESKSAIKWTEDDQKNVVDLGNLELERNQWLETLIARRRATKSFKLTAEKNLIDFDNPDNPFNVTSVSTTRNNPFDHSYSSSYASMGLPPIPGSAPSVLLPGRNPFHLPSVSNQEKHDLQSDNFQQHFMTSHPKEVSFCRHESFSLGTSNLGDRQKERKDVNWRPVFMPEQLVQEATSYSSLQRQLSDASDTKLRSASETESVSSTADLEERKFSEQDFTKEAEVISHIYNAYELVGQESQSSEDVDTQEMERARKTNVQHGKLEIKLGTVENRERSLSNSGGLAPLVDSEVQFKPESFKEDSSTRSSLSSPSEVEEKTPDLTKGRIRSLDSTGDLVVKVAVLPESPLGEAEVLFTSGDDNHLKEPIYDSSPTASEKLIVFDSISSEIRADISEIIYFSEADADLSKNIDAKAVSSDFSDEYVSSKDKPPSELEKSFSDKFNTEPRSDDHNAFDEPEIIQSESNDYSSIIRDVNALKAREVQDHGSNKLSTIQEPIPSHPLVNHVSVSKEANVGELPRSSYSQYGLTKVGTNAVGSTKDVASNNEGSGVQETSTLDTVLKQAPEGNVGGLPKRLNSKGGSDSLGTNEVGYTKEIASSSGESNNNETIATLAVLRHASEGNVGYTPKVSDSTDELTNVGANAVGSTLDVATSDSRYGIQNTITSHTALKQVPEVIVGELPKPSNSKDESINLGTNAVGSTKEVASSNAGSGVQETVTTNNEVLKQVTEGAFSQLPKPSSSKDGSEKLGTHAVASREIASTDTGSSVHETVTSHTALKQVSEDGVGELPKSSDSKDSTDAVGSTKEFLSSDARSGVQQIITTQMALKQTPRGNGNELPILSNSKAESTKVSSLTVSGVQESITTDAALRTDSDGNVGEMPKSSDRKEYLNTVGSNVVDSTTDIESNNAGTRGQKPITTHSASDQVLEGNEGEFPKESSSKDGYARAEANALDSSKEIAKSNTESSSPENATTPIALKQVSEVNVSELPKPSVSELKKPETNAVRSAMEAASSNTGSGVQEYSTAGAALMQDSNGNVDNSKKASSSIKRSIEVGTSAAGSIEEIASSNPKSGIATISIHSALKQVSEGNESELPEPSDSTNELAKAETNVMGSTNESHNGLKEVSEANLTEQPKPSDSRDRSTNEGSNALDSTMEVSSSNVTTHTALEQTPGGNRGELSNLLSWMNWKK